jgi:hypothetical protein
MTYKTFEAVQFSIDLHGYEFEAAIHQANQKGFSSVEEYATEMVRLKILNNLEKEKGLFLNAHIARKEAELRERNAEDTGNGTDGHS